MRQEFQEIFNFTITIREVIANVAMATLCGIFISVFYAFASRGISYSLTLVRSIIMLSMITAFVMMVIGDNLARAFGMVGIISIIQFRSAMKEGAQNFMFLYFALAMGLASGVGLYSVALVGTMMIGLITSALTQLNASNTPRRDFSLQILCTMYVDEEKQYGDTIRQFCKHHKLIAVKAAVKDKESLTRFAYHVRLKTNSTSEGLVRALQAVEGVREVNLQFEEE